MFCYHSMSLIVWILMFFISYDHPFGSLHLLYPPTFHRFIWNNLHKPLFFKLFFFFFFQFQRNFIFSNEMDHRNATKFHWNPVPSTFLIFGIPFISPNLLPHWMIPFLSSFFSKVNMKFQVLAFQSVESMTQATN